MTRDTLDKIGKLTRLAMNHAAYVGEIDEASKKIFHFLRQSGIPLTDVPKVLAASIGATLSAPVQQKKPRPNAECKFTSGPHAGRSFAQVLVIDADYLFKLAAAPADTPVKKYKLQLLQQFLLGA